MARYENKGRILQKTYLPVFSALHLYLLLHQTHLDSEASFSLHAEFIIAMSNETMRTAINFERIIKE
jgi:hypothetical protein